MTIAYSVRVRGAVQGVGFRPFVYRLARANTLAGWVSNGNDGVEIFLEGAADRVESFLHDLRASAPPAAEITGIDVGAADLSGLQDFSIRPSATREHPTVRVTPDLATCDACLAELFDPGDRRFHYPYINCTNCGPRYSIVLALPYDRRQTTMAPWALDEQCAAEYDDPSDRRFHAQPIACPHCGPHYRFERAGNAIAGDDASIAAAAQLLHDGGIVAVKGIGGYHLACDAGNESAVAALRERKFRKEKPFALMCRDLEAVSRVAMLSPGTMQLLTSAARPIVLAPAKTIFSGVAPGNADVGVMLPYTPLHALLFAAGAPDVMVFTSANRSSEPIAYEDAAALEELSGLADAFLVGERPIARRVEDSVVRAGTSGPMILRRARGYAPGAVAHLPATRPVLALGADLKNAVTLVVDGQAFVGQHIGDLDQYQSFQAFDQSVHDLLGMYDVAVRGLIVAHDAHPQYRSTTYAAALEATRHVAIQHHRAHIASVLAERGAWDEPVVALAVDGTGYGDDGTIWGCELFVGSITAGFERAASLRPAALVGGDAAAKHPVQAAAGFLAQLDVAPDLEAAPFTFPARYRDASRLLASGTRVFQTTSAGRLFDAAAALLGFVRPVTFEGQAAIWLEQQARTSVPVDPYPFPFRDGQLDFRPLLAALIADRIAERDVAAIARAFQAGVAHGLAGAATELCRARGITNIVASGGVMQNALLLDDLEALFAAASLTFHVNHLVPPNDGGISLGQAALVALEKAAQ